MDDERNSSFKLFMLVCSISIAVEIVFSIWTSIQILKLDLNSSSVESVKLAGKGVITLIMSLLGNWVTMIVSMVIPDKGIWKLYNKCLGHPYHWIATILLLVHVCLPIVSTISTLSGFSLIKSAGFSLFEMILSLL